MAGKMTAPEVEEAVGRLPGWETDGDRAITRRFKFRDHIEAMGFVTRVAMVAETMNHHPDLRIVYNAVEIRLSSHDVGGVTDRDTRLAERINALA